MLFKDNLKEFRLSNLITELGKFSELERIRYTTSHPIDMTDDLLDCYKNNRIKRQALFGLLR